LPIVALDGGSWTVACAEAVGLATGALETGAVLFLPRLAFEIRADERLLFSPSIATAKNVSFDSWSGRVVGAQIGGLGEGGRPAFEECCSGSATARPRWLEHSCPIIARDSSARGTSYRPVEIAGRATSWRQDDTLLHIDSFPATPVMAGGSCVCSPTSIPTAALGSGGVGESLRRSCAAICATVAPADGRKAAVLPAAPDHEEPPLGVRCADAAASRRDEGDAVYQAEASQTSIDFHQARRDRLYRCGQPRRDGGVSISSSRRFCCPWKAWASPNARRLRILERLKGRRLV